MRFEKIIIGQRGWADLFDAMLATSFEEENIKRFAKYGITYTPRRGTGNQKPLSHHASQDALHQGTQ